jgi:septum formation protein
VDESRLPGETPGVYVERLARAKAGVIAIVEPRALVIGGDTVVVDGEDVLSKPENAEAAVSMLLRLAGREHDVLSGIAVAGPEVVPAAGASADLGSPRTVSTVARTRVVMRAFDEEMARAYVETGEPFDKAGGYGIQGQGAALVAEVRGDYNAVVGFPVGAFLDLLGELGWRLNFDGTVTSDPA